MIDMTELSAFARQVLAFIEPDVSRQNLFVTEAKLVDPCTSEAMNRFVLRLEQARSNQEKVLVAGDYDCDGILSTSIMTYALQDYGLQAGYYIPDRIREGYGLSCATVRLAKEKGYSLIITVDNGVKAFEAMETARELGIEVIITDHHLIEEPVEDCLLLHPATLGDPFSTLCGSGIAFECARALGQGQDRFLVWAAIASIGDCMEVTGQTRAIITQGLRLFNQSPDAHFRPFVRSLPITENDAAFQIVPKINAIGRMAHKANPNTFVRYLNTHNPAAIDDYAGKLIALNEQRRELSEQTCERALTLITPYHSVLLAMDPSFHEGVIGLAAGSICTRFGKPAIVCTESDKGIKGSMRAPAGFHCMDFLRQFDGYAALGGHAQAAGFTIAPDRYEDFRTFVVQQGRQFDWEPVPVKAMDINPEDITVENVRSLDVLRPFGTGFEPPRFMLENPPIISSFDLSAGRHRKMMLSNQVAMLHFNQTSSDLAQKTEDIETVYGTMSLSTFRNQVSADFLIDEIVYKEHG